MKYGVIFNNVVFSIITESYTPEEVEEITEKIESNGGSVISEHIENSCAKYLIMNDGYKHWNGFVLDKNKDGKYVISHRFLDRCLIHKKIFKLQKEKAMDLLPLPFQTPYEGFENYCVAFSLFGDYRKDMEALTNLATLMGMKIEFTEQNTTHLIINTDKVAFIDKSAKVTQVKRTFKKRKPKVVKFEWFLQCLLSGEPEPEDEHLIDLS